jgi:hypothetical protein
VKIKRHKLPSLESCQEVLRRDSERLQQYLNTARLDSTKVCLLCDMLMEMVRCGAAVGTDSTSIVSWLRLAVPDQVVIALFPKIRLYGFWHAAGRFPELWRILENEGATARFFPN